MLSVVRADFWKQRQLMPCRHSYRICQSGVWTVLLPWAFFSVLATDSQNPHNMAVASGLGSRCSGAWTSFLAVQSLHLLGTALRSGHCCTCSNDQVFKNYQA